MPSTLAPAPPPPVNPTEGALKAVLIVTLFLATFLASMFAFVLKRHAIQAHSPRAVVGFSLVSCFGAGVFLGTCLLDLLPDSVECVAKAFKFLKKDVDFPVAEFCVVMGFLMVLFIEQTIIFAREQNWIGDTEVERLLGDHHEDHGLPDSPSAGPEEHLGDESHDVHFDPESHSSIRAILLVCALSLHAVFEGLSLGLITQVPVLLQVFGALFIHKSIIGFSLGVRLVQSRLRNMTVVICCTVFAAQVLIGGFFGYGIIKFMDTSSKGTTHLVSGILQSIACGTFLYITSFEILPHELNQRGHRPLKFVLLLLGFFVVAGFVFMFPDQDDD
uniref:Zinc transporter ZIP3 n=1 Tax=Panagrellus redivivus TaxID=6233 RepID=A0A7E4W4J9_PANRE